MRIDRMLTDLVKGLVVVFVLHTIEIFAQNAGQMPRINWLP